MCSLYRFEYCRRGQEGIQTKKFKHFLSIANGSCYELQTQLILTYELNLIEKYKIDELLPLIAEIQKMNYSF